MKNEASIMMGLLVVLAMASESFGAMIKFTNTNSVFDQRVSGVVGVEIPLGPGVPPATTVLPYGPIDVEDGGMFFLGGPNGVAPTTDLWTTPTLPTTFKVTEPTGDFLAGVLTIVANGILLHNGVNMLIDINFGDPNYTREILYSFDNLSNVPGTQPLLANAEFAFMGFDLGTDAPDLRLVSDSSIRITDIAGDLLPQFQFSGETTQAALVQIIPVPASLSLLTLGGVTMLFRRRPTAITDRMAARGSDRMRPSLLTAGAVAAVLVAAPALSAEKSGPDALDAYCQVIAQSGFSGTVLAIRDGKVVLQQGYGLANRERKIGNAPETLFEIASLSKQFTAAAILKLEQDGRLSTDDRIGQHLPGVPDAYGTVTIQHLLTHTGGLPRGGPGRGLDLEPAVRAHLDQPPIGKPGARYAYSNIDYALLSGIVEQASGTSFEAYCRKMLFQPAGMTATGFCGEEFDDADVALGYSARGGAPRAPHVDPYPPLDQFGYEYRGMGGVVTNAIDLARWCRALQGDAILAKEAKTKLFTPVTRNYACGWEVFQFPDGRQCIGHGGAVQGFVCKLWTFPEDRSLLLVLSNNDAFDRSWLNGLYDILFDVPAGERIRRVRSQAPGRSPPPRRGLPDAIPATDAELDKLVGAYTSSGDVALRLEIRRKDAGLATTITAPARQAPLNDHEDLRRLTKSIIDGLGRGDVGPLADTMMPNIPQIWPEIIRTEIWPPHMQRRGALEGHDVLGVEPMAGTGGDIVLVWTRLRHTNGEAVAMLGYHGVRLQLLVLDISDFFCPDDGPSFLKRASGSFMVERKQSFPSMLTQQTDGAVRLQSGGIGLSFVPE